RAARRLTRAAAIFLGCALSFLAQVSPTGAAAPSGARITDDLYGTHFVSPDEGWAVGTFGAIFRTHDGGRTWRPQVSHTSEQLFSIDFADPANGWTVGGSGLILHTQDGGETWQIQNSGTDHHLFKVTALDPQHAWAVGDWGTMLATQDGGKTWENRSLSRDVILYGQSWPDATHSWVVGEGGVILVTTDGGQTWTDQTSGVEKTLFGVFFADTQRGWATGIDGLLLHTTDGGQTWQLQRGKAEVGELEQVGVAEALGNAGLYAVAVDGKIGYAVGDIGTVFVTTDGGETWRRVEMPGESSFKWMRDVSLVTGARGLLVGANGTVIRVAGARILAPEKGTDAPTTSH